MDKKIKKLWVKALRSGRYKQGNNALKNRHDGTYCCLGVLCNIMGAKWREDDYGDLRPFISGKLVGKPGTEAGFLGSTILRKAGMRDSTQKRLANMNDHGQTFKQIADYIEKRL